MVSIKKLNRSRRVNRSRLGTVLLIVLLLLFAVFMAMPMALMISNAFKRQDELWVFPPRLFPSNPTIGNFHDMFTVMSESMVPFLRYVFNSVLITSAGSAGHIVVSSMCAFVLAKKKFPGRDVIFNIIVLALMFNAAVTMIPNYLVMSGLKWIDTYAALIIPAFGAPLGLYLMKQFMEQLPDTLLEAARIDGASQWKTFWRIVMPNVRSAWMTLLLLSVQSLWALGDNNFIYREELKTLPYALGQIMGTGAVGISATGIARAGVGAAVSVLMMAVPIMIFLFSQSNIIETMSSSGLKD